jgi:hypothetical protein
MWKKFKKKPVIIDAIYFDPECKQPVLNDLTSINQSIYGSFDGDIPCIKIPTLEGEMIAREGDWIIKGIQGELYPCKPDIFEETYEEIEIAVIKGVKNK